MSKFLNRIFVLSIVTLIVDVLFYYFDPESVTIILLSIIIANSILEDKNN